MRTTLTAAVLMLALAGGVRAQEAIDELKVLPFPAATPYRVWVTDLAFNHLVDSRMHIVDGKTGAYQGQLSIGFGGAPVLSPDKSKLYVVTTYYDRLTRGNKFDVLETYDANTLTF